MMYIVLLDNIIFIIKIIILIIYFSILMKFVILLRWWVWVKVLPKPTQFRLYPRSLNRAYCFVSYSSTSFFSTIFLFNGIRFSGLQTSSMTSLFVFNRSHMRHAPSQYNSTFNLLNTMI